MPVVRISSGSFRPTSLGDAGDGDVAAVEGADEHASERLEVRGAREVAGCRRLPERRSSRLDEARLE